MEKGKAQVEDTSDIDTSHITDREEEGGVAEKVTAEASGSGLDARTRRRWMSSPDAEFAIQCNDCYKWRFIPSKEKYEARGEHILEQPFVCADAKDWKRNLTCDAPADVDEDNPDVLWAIDVHNIPCAPKGFYRDAALRNNNERKFADVIYKTPCGQTLNSGVQVKKYLDEHPEIDARDSQFCFTAPKSKEEALGSLETGKSSNSKRAMKRARKDRTQSGSKPHKHKEGSIPNPDPIRMKDLIHGLQQPPPRPRPGTGSGTQSGPKPHKHMKGSIPNSEPIRMNAPGHCLPPPSPPPLPGTGSSEKSDKPSVSKASKSSALRRDKDKPN